MVDQRTIPDDLLTAAASVAPGDPTLQEGIALALMEERERCASIAETHPKYRAGGWSGNPTCHAIANAIRTAKFG